MDIKQGKSAGKGKASTGRAKTGPAGPARARRGRAGGAARAAEIRRVASAMFKDSGYDAATMRAIAAEVGIEAPSLYNHFRSKQALLADILSETMKDLIVEVREALRVVPDEPAAQLQAAAERYVRFHREHLIEASISETELRSLEPDNLERVLALRHELGGIFKEIVHRGAAGGVFRTRDPSIAAMAVLTVCSRFPSWYREDGRQSIEELAVLLSRCVVRAVGGTDDAAPPATGRASESTELASSHSPAGC